MKIVTIASVKGGTGRTTVAAHLGALLGLEDSACLVVDLDPQNALGLWFGMDPGEPFGLARHAAAAEDVAQFVRRLRSDVPFIPFGDVAVDDLRDLEIRVDQDGEWLRRRLHVLAAGRYDMVVIDVPSGLGPLTRQALLAADLVLAVHLPDGASYATLPAFEAVVEEVCESRPDFRGVFHLLNQLDARRTLHRDARAAMANLLQDALLPVTLPPDEAVREAFARRRTLIYENPESPVLVGLREVALWLRDLVEAPHAPAVVHQL